ncbi:Shedu immune nuclease family protein [Jiella mangrovi]|uniref:DUF4263 domain-containing protein n=1 Tax=Jiella mangrovi TaxID=2821407 RepID=A0ABS4BND8_9HYPH|nr:Shedu immune nuclease family protein [Jiella mangrovi]MBP0618267.1 DUF4263 domain-containing protein [Jiella mangrovi]
MNGFRGETDFVADAKRDCLYRHPFRDGAGAYFNAVIEEQSVEYDANPDARNRIKIQFKFLEARGEVTELVIKKFKHYKSDGWVEQRTSPDEPLKLNYLTSQKLFALCRAVSDLNLKGWEARRAEISFDPSSQIDPAIIDSIKGILSQDENGGAIVRDIINSGAITSQDIVNLAYRRAQVDRFSDMMNDRDQIIAYAKENGIREDQPEKAWQHFFEKNTWIFGFGLDFRFFSILQREAAVGRTGVSGDGSAFVDFLGKINKFTVLVELKLPTTPLMNNFKAATNSYSLSTACIRAHSQILAQKADWQIKSEDIRFDKNGDYADFRAVDPKVILIIGSNDGLIGKTEAETGLIRKTFEMYRRDSRNVEIITYSEMLERDQFLVR